MSYKTITLTDLEDFIAEDFPDGISQDQEHNAVYAFKELEDGTFEVTKSRDLAFHVGEIVTQEQINIRTGQDE